MNKPDISVIIPVYNCEKYIARCLASILRQQGVDKYEIIVVDDGSTDRTGEIIDKFANKYKNIRVIHQKNMGVSAARNVGIEASHGKYVAFVDGDDMVGLNYNTFRYRFFYKPELYPYMENTQAPMPKTFVLTSDFWSKTYFINMLKAAEQTNSDIVFGGKVTLNHSEQRIKNYVFTEQITYGTDSDDKLAILKLADTRESANFALYRRDMLNKHNLRFLENMNLDEDILFCMSAVIHAKKIATAPDVTYLYNRHPDTLSYEPSEFVGYITIIQLYTNILNELIRINRPDIFNTYIRQYSNTADNEFPDAYPGYIQECAYCGEQNCKNCPFGTFERLKIELPLIIDKYSGRQ